MDRGAHVEGFPSQTPSSAFDLIAQLVGGDAASPETRQPEERRVETPLQLAAAAGDRDMAAMLMVRGADPYLSLGKEFVRGWQSQLEDRKTTELTKKKFSWTS